VGISKIWTAAIAVAIAALTAGCASTGATNGTEGATSEPTVVVTEPASPEAPESTPTLPTTPDPAPTAPSLDDVAVVDAVTVTGPPGEEPSVTVDFPQTVSFPTTRLLAEGEGDPLENGELVRVNAVAWRGDTGEQVFSTWADGMPATFALGGRDFALFSEALQGANVGARALIANPTNLQGQLLSLFTVIEVESASPARATGAAVPADPALPVVTLAANGAPTIVIPDGYQPSDELVVQTLIQGEGPVVAVGQQLMVHYTGWLLDGTQFDSSWPGQSPASFPLASGQLIEGWVQGLAGQHVGSQVLLVVPPELGYQDRTMGSIPPNSTLIFVVDILAAD